MNESKRASRPVWVDPDDAPELTEESFKKGVWKIGDRVVSSQEGENELRKILARGRPVGSEKSITTIRLDDEVLNAFKASSKGWQTRINAALKDWLKTHSPT